MLHRFPGLLSKEVLTGEGRDDLIEVRTPAEPLSPTCFARGAVIIAECNDSDDVNDDGDADEGDDDRLLLLQSTDQEWN